MVLLATLFFLQVELLLLSGQNIYGIDKEQLLFSVLEFYNVLSKPLNTAGKQTLVGACMPAGSFVEKVR